MDKKDRARRILDILETTYPDAKVALQYSNPLELLIATMLSAQTTDKHVNTVTPALFKKYCAASDYANAPLDALEAAISSINFYRNKAKGLKGAAQKIVSDFGGSVPASLDALISLPGVGRKTANVVLGNAFGKDALAVDTHVKRVAGRLGLTSGDTPDEIESELCAIIAQRRWTRTTLLFITHGRNLCKAKAPLCGQCALKDLCDYYKKTVNRDRERK